MKIDILSDLHADFWFRPYETLEKKAVEKLFLPIVTPDGGAPGDVLVVAGDLGHHNEQSARLLAYLQDIFGYRAVVCVLGNHDYYLILSEARRIYRNDSFARVAEMRKLLAETDGVHCLNGNVVDIDGVRFGGCDGWYDGEYAVRNILMTRSRIRALWKHTMNDAWYIHGMEDWMAFADVQKRCLEKIAGEVDVMVTHVNPSVDRSFMPKRWRDEDIMAFFSFDGEEILKKGSMRYWIFGHQHERIEYEKEGVKCLCNPLGYPNEKRRPGIMRIEFEK